jgi:hypothetical protein
MIVCDHPIRLGIVLLVLSLLIGCIAPEQQYKIIKMKNKRQSINDYCYTGKRLCIAVVPISQNKPLDKNVKLIANDLLHLDAIHQRFETVERIGMMTMITDPNNMMHQEVKLSDAQFVDKKMRLKISLDVLKKLSRSIFQDKSRSFQYKDSNLKLIFNEYKRTERNTGELRSGYFQAAECMLFVSAYQVINDYWLTVRLIELETQTIFCDIEKKISANLTRKDTYSLASDIFNQLERDLPIIDGKITNNYNNKHIDIQFSKQLSLKENMKVELFQVIPDTQTSMTAGCIPTQKTGEARIIRQHKNGVWFAQIIEKTAPIQIGNIVITK